MALQGDFTPAWLKRRLIERWGERGTLRAIERNVRSMVGWGVRRDDGVRGVLVASAKLPVTGGAIGELLLGSLVVGAEAGELPLGRLLAHPALPRPSCGGRCAGCPR